MEIFKYKHFDCCIFAKTNTQDFWFKKDDVIAILDYGNTKHLYIRREWVKFGSYLNILPSSADDTVFINEAGVYVLINNSRNERALEFQKWLNEEILPSLRNKFSYSKRCDGDKAGQVYFATNEYLNIFNVYKVGCTNNIYTELNLLNSCSIDDYKFEYVYDCKDMFLANRLIKKFLDKYKYKTGFYKIDRKEVIKDALNYLNEKL